MSIFAPDEDKRQRWGATSERSQPGTQCFRDGSLPHGAAFLFDNTITITATVYLP